MSPALLLAALLASAPPAEPAPRHTLSLLVPSLLLGGVALQGERHLASGEASLSCSAGVRGAAGGDYASLSLATGVEVRRWLAGPPSSMGACARGGPYAALRLDFGFNRLVARAGGREIGTTWTTAQQLALGYRFPFRCRLEVTPSVGLSVRTALDGKGRLAALPHGALVGGLTVGWMF